MSRWISVQHHDTVEWYNWTRRSLTDNVAAKSVLIQNIPNRFGFSTEVRNWADADNVYGGLSKPLDAGFVGVLAFDNARPGNRDKMGATVARLLMTSWLTKSFEIECHPGVQ